jgi:hypothetical protein
MNIPKTGKFSQVPGREQKTAPVIRCTGASIFFKLRVIL